MNGAINIWSFLQFAIDWRRSKFSFDSLDQLIGKAVFCSLTGFSIFVSFSCSSSFLGFLIRKSVKMQFLKLWKLNIGKSLISIFAKKMALVNKIFFKNSGNWLDEFWIINEKSFLIACREALNLWVSISVHTFLIFFFNSIKNWRFS